MEVISYDRREPVRLRNLYAHLKAAMSLQDAANILGVSPDASPDEIAKAYKKKVFENHPDRGGDPDKMVEVNVAKEILEGKRRPDLGSSPGGGGHYSQPDVDTSWYTSSPRPKREKEEVSFEKAKDMAGVPSGVTWVFKTDTMHGGYGDKSVIGFVIYGKTDSKHIFVGVENYSNRNAFTGEDTDVWSMRVYDYPLSGKTVAELAPKVIREAFGDFKHCDRKYNAKVQMLDGETTFKQQLATRMTRSIAFKDAMVMLGEVNQDHAWANRKLTVEIRLKSAGAGYNDYSVILTINGKDYDLGTEAYKKLDANYGKVKNLIFGDYAYEDSKKVITRMQKAKPILKWLAEKVATDDDLKQALLAAAEQAKG